MKYVPSFCTASIVSEEKGTTTDPVKKAMEQCEKPYEIVVNKCDLPVDRDRIALAFPKEQIHYVSAKNQEEIVELREKIARNYEKRVGEAPRVLVKDLSPYAMIVHCGGCTLHANEMKRRLGLAEQAGVPMTNYGTLIAYMNGILERCMRW